MLPIIAAGLAYMFMDKNNSGGGDITRKERFVPPIDRNAKVRLVAAILVRNGFSPFQVRLGVTMAMLESAWLTNRGAKSLNNLTGIKKAGQPANVAFQKELGATFTPVGAAGEGGTFYAVYPNVDCWARDFKRILSMNGSLGVPILATNASVFVDRLIANNYMKGTGPHNYKAGFPGTFKGVVSILS